MLHDQLINSFMQLSPLDFDDPALMKQVHDFADRRLSPTQKQSIQQAITGLVREMEEKMRRKERKGRDIIF